MEGHAHTANRLVSYANRERPVRSKGATATKSVEEGSTSTRSFARGWLLAGVLALVALLLVPSAAFARTTRAYESSFGLGSIPAGNRPEAITVDQATGDIYVTSVGSDPKSGAISRFTAAGAPKNFTAGPAAGTNTLTGFGGGGGAENGTVAIDRSGGGLDGTIYLVDVAANSGTVKVFANDGAPIGAIDGSGNNEGSFDQLCGVAVDQANGDVYFSQSSGANAFGKIWRYSQSAPSESVDDGDFTVTGTSSWHICDLAVDSGDVYAVEPEFSGSLFKYTSASFTSVPPPKNDGTVIDKGPVTAVGVDPKTGEVYSDHGRQIAVFGSNGQFLYRFGTAHDFGISSEGVAIKSAASGAAEKVYVADRHPGGMEIDVFGPVSNVPSFSHPEITAFGEGGSPGSTFDARVDQVALDEVAKKLYVAEIGQPGAGTAKLFGFDASGSPAYSPLAGFSPLSTAALWAGAELAVDDTGLASSGNVYLASDNTNLIYGFDSNGAPLDGAFPIDPAVNPGAPSGTPTNLCGAAVDSSGNLWVSNAAKGVGGTDTILKYSSTGASLPGAIDTSAQGSGQCQIAFDSEDNLYAVMRGRSVWRYDAAGGYTSAKLVEGFSSTGGAFNVAAPASVSGIAVDPATDHFYVAHSLGFPPTGENRVYSSWVDEYDAAGSFVDEFDLPAGAEIRGIAVDGTSHDLYLADRTSKRVLVLGPSAVLPEVTIGAASGVANTAATLSGIVGAQGIALTDCHFEYVSQAAFRAGGFSDLSSGGSAPCAPSAGSIPADFATHNVSASVTGLQRSTQYRFRLVAANATASTGSGVAEFTTQGPAIVETTGAPIHTTTTAQLTGRVDPRSAPATYHFEYGSEGPCDSSPCASTDPKPAGSGDFSQLVSEEISGLEAGLTYHYRLVADNGNPDGASFGGDMNVTTRTLAEEEPLDHGRFPGPPGSDRAWEQINSPEIGGNPVEGEAVISDNGQRAVWELAGGSPISDVGGFNQLYSERTPNGWQTRRIAPPRDELVGANWHPPIGRSDLSTFYVLNFTIAGAYGLYRVSPEAPPLKLQAVASEFERIPFEFASDDGSKVLMGLRISADPAYPIPPAPGRADLFEISSGSPHLVNLLPGNAVPACGVSTDETAYASPAPAARSAHWVSADGSRAFFQSSGNNCGSQAKTYMRDFDAEESTLLPGPVVSGPDCGTAFIKSTEDAAFFWTKGRFVSEDVAPPNCTDESANGDIYRYDLGSRALSCVTCAVADSSADVFIHGVVPVRSISISEDGSRAYFTSASRLLPGARTPGVYRVDVQSGDLAYVGAVAPEAFGQAAALSRDGSEAFFSSSEPTLNALGAGAGNAGTKQLYRYDDNDRSLVCISCPRDGSAPRGAASGSGGGSNSPNVTPLSENGTFAFSTPTALLDADQNTAAANEDAVKGADVYEWRDGRLLLVTDGLTFWSGGEAAPNVKGITPSGRDLLFTAGAQLTPDALDDFRRLYDARIGGGFEFPKPPPPCPLEVCQGTPKGAPEEQAPGTGAFAGPGNAKAPPASCRRGKVRRKGRCVAKQPVRKHHRSRANHNRRTAR